MNARKVYLQLQAVQRGGSHPVFWGHLKYGNRVGWMDGNMKSDQSFSETSHSNDLTIEAGYVCISMTSY